MNATQTKADDQNVNRVTIHHTRIVFEVCHEAINRNAGIGLPGVGGFTGRDNIAACDGAACFRAKS